MAISKNVHRNYARGPVTSVPSVTDKNPRQESETIFFNEEQRKLMREGVARHMETLQGQRYEVVKECSFKVIDLRK